MTSRQLGEVREQVRLQQLHEGGGVGVEVVGPGGVEVLVGHGRDVAIAGTSSSTIAS
jgi:hypothetical protein